MGRFDGKVAIVTGAAQGIGEQYTRALARDGASVVTQQLATELGGSGIRINAIAPGPIDTEATRTVTPPEIVRQMVERLPIKRMGTPRDLVGMCLFLLSDEAGWITGQIFNVDGGQVIR